MKNTLCQLSYRVLAVALALAAMGVGEASASIVATKAGWVVSPSMQ